jgi:hypothetical protein
MECDGMIPAKMVSIVGLVIHPNLSLAETVLSNKHQKKFFWR